MMGDPCMLTFGCPGRMTFLNVCSVCGGTPPRKSASATPINVSTEVILGLVGGAAGYVAGDDNWIATVIGAIVGYQVGRTKLGKAIVVVLGLILCVTILRFCDGVASAYR